VRGPRGLLAGAGIACLVLALLGTAAVGPAVALLGVGTEPPGPSSEALATIPGPMLALYQAAAATCPGLPWTVLAAVGTVESDNGQSAAPGVHSGANAAGAEGPMQFEPATFAAYSEPVPPGGAQPASPYDATDAVYAASRLLCADGAAGGADIPAALFAYNHSAAYVAQVLALAASFGQPATPGPATGAGPDAGGIAVAWALAQIGTPYVWGGQSPGVGFDCSGLVRAAWAAAGVGLPRVAQDQYDATPKLSPGTPLAPGDLVFFGQGPASVDHVGLFVGVDRTADGPVDVMVDAPHTGADVRAEAFAAGVGAPFGSLRYVGATRPATG